ncbi:MAG: hypothetical protein ACI9CD_000304 [Candidatus Deianiraeaceae bacterium]|jgi:hypothetical protein
MQCIPSPYVIHNSLKTSAYCTKFVLKNEDKQLIYTRPTGALCWLL